VVYIKKNFVVGLLIIAIFIGLFYLSDHFTGKQLLIPPYDLSPPYSGAPASKEVRTIREIEAGKIETVLSSSSNIAIDRIKFSLNKDVEDLKITLGKPSSFREDFLFPPGTIYQIFEITFEDVEKSSFTQALIRFQVEKDWFSQKGFNKDEIKLLRSTGTAWENLGASYLKTQNPYHLYEASIDGFSFFAIVAQHTDQPITPPLQPPQEPEEEQPPQEPSCGNSIRDTGENCQNCPSDARCAPDEVCQSGICTVREEIPSPQPKRESPAQIPSPKKSSTFYIIISAVVLFGLLIAFFIYFKTIKGRGQVPPKQLGLPSNKEALQLKMYMQQFRAQGHSRDDMRRGALRSGWPEKLVEDILKQIK